MRSRLADMGGICWLLCEAWTRDSDDWGWPRPQTVVMARAALYTWSNTDPCLVPCPFIIWSLWKSTDEQPPTAPQSQTFLKFYKLHDNEHILKRSETGEKNTWDIIYTDSKTHLWHSIPDRKVPTNFSGWRFHQLRLSTLHRTSSRSFRSF